MHTIIEGIVLIIVAAPAVAFCSMFIWGIICCFTNWDDRF